MKSTDRPEINMSGIPVAGVGGIGLVVLALVMTIVLPEARWVFVTGLAGGGLLGAALVFIRRHSRSDGPSGSNPAVLFRSENPVTSGREPSRAPGSGDLEQLVALARAVV